MSSNKILQRLNKMAESDRESKDYLNGVNGTISKIH